MIAIPRLARPSTCLAVVALLCAVAQSIAGDGAIGNSSRGFDGRFPKPHTELWSFQPVVRPTAPAVAHAAMIRNPVDAFIIDRLEKAALAPAPRADRRVLVRRLHLTLHGLAPSPESLARWVEDDRDDWFERLVDELLASPRYGERWATHWLDLVRYADSNGFETNRPRPTAYHYRDYVIAAFNDDKPYIRFVAEQLAGDALGVDAATGFLVAGPHDIVAGQNQELTLMQRSDGLADIVNATTTTLMGLTVACARCHDHKFDAISQHDYYATEAVFAGVQHAERPLEPHAYEQLKQSADAAADRLASIETELAASIVTAWNEPVGLAAKLVEAFTLTQLLAAKRDELAKWPMAYVGAFTEPPATHLLSGGDPQSPAEVVAPGCLAEFGTLELAAEDQEQHRRLAYAEWLGHPAHPLTARVMANRIWQHHFGRGIVATSSDFGENGAPPSHPQLLDYLASELVAHGWSIKHLQRLIVLSAAYQQSSMPSEAGLAADAGNELVWRFAPRRLEAEAIRDGVLAASGKLDLTMGGPGFALFEHQPGNVYNYVPKATFAPAEWRRMIYAERIRGEQDSTVGAFDCPDGGQSAPRRERSTTPLQALNLLNSPFIGQQAAFLAERAAKEAAGHPSAQVERMFQLTLQRSPKPTEREWASELVRTHGLPALGRALFNANEFLFVF